MCVGAVKNERVEKFSSFLPQDLNCALLLVSLFGKESCAGRSDGNLRSHYASLMSSGQAPHYHLSSESYDPLNADAFEIAVEMSSGEPLRFSKSVLLEHRILSEYALVCREPIDGMYITPSKENLSVWFGVLFIRRGVYMGAVLRFTLTLPVDFGESVELPKIVFDLSVFHPHFDPVTHELDLRRYFPDGWKVDRHHMLHVLLVIQRTFFTYDADAETCKNPEAAAMLQSDREGFLSKAQDIIRESRSKVYDVLTSLDPYAIRFFPWDASVHEPLRQRLIGSLTESQVSSSSLLGSLGCSSTSNMSMSCGKAGYSWLSPSEGLFMMEQSQHPEFEAPVRNILIRFSNTVLASHNR